MCVSVMWTDFTWLLDYLPSADSSGHFNIAIGSGGMFDWLNRVAVGDSFPKKAVESCVHGRQNTEKDRGKDRSMGYRQNAWCWTIMDIRGQKAFWSRTERNGSGRWRYCCVPWHYQCYDEDDMMMMIIIGVGDGEAGGGGGGGGGSLGKYHEKIRHFQANIMQNSAIFGTCLKFGNFVIFRQISSKIRAILKTFSCIYFWAKMSSPCPKFNQILYSCDDETMTADVHLFRHLFFVHYCFTR